MRRGEPWIRERGGLERQRGRRKIESVRFLLWMEVPDSTVDPGGLGVLSRKTLRSLRGHFI